MSQQLTRNIPTELFKKSPELIEFSFEKLPKEGSNKEFFRLTKTDQKKSFILMYADDSQKSKGTLKDWVIIQKNLAQQGIKTPRVHRYFEQENAVIMEDCKDLLLTDRINRLYQAKDKTNLIEYYKRTTQVLEKMQKTCQKPLKQKLCKKTLSQDLMLFFEEHIKKRVTKKPSFWNEESFFAEVSSICHHIDSLEKVFTHRDFHSGNLLVLEKELVLIDFQDACQGPRAYDFASFFLDPYIKIPAKEKEELFLSAIEKTSYQLSKESYSELQNSWKAVAIQRLYKILGSYNYLSKQKGKEKFSSFIKPTLEILATLDLFCKEWPYLTKELKEGIINIGA